MAALLSDLLKRHQPDFHPVVPFDPARERLCSLDFTENNTQLLPEEIADTARFAAYINRMLEQQQARYGFGGYGEHRTLYARSKHFDQPIPGSADPAIRPAADAGQNSRANGGQPTGSKAARGASSGSEAARSVSRGSEAARGAGSPDEAEPRRLHLGIDIWGPAGTRVMSPLNGIVHSFAFNNNDSDYGTTIILSHNLEGVGFHTLYGHLSLNSIKNLSEGRNIRKGEVIGEFGMRFENGNWPSHLHFQLIEDISDWKGDYPGVCRFSEKRRWLDNCPDPDLVLQLGQYIK
ncbi:MAG TPA: peptidoglycan DD-metalloendopeptidase family protein [Puia sp.]|jgi:murein DD-endopeptidase MepM/ murein hydrolase activator NlpD|nr:peptidoglycan DD-metalloendopeptidase family protein [Puia sp.]